MIGDSPKLAEGEKFSITLTAELYERLEAEAVRDERSRSAVIRRALTWYLSAQRWISSTKAVVCVDRADLTRVLNVLEMAKVDEGTVAAPTVQLCGDDDAAWARLRRAVKE